MTRHKTPEFWYNTTSPRHKIMAQSLSCLSALYTIGHLAHQAIIPARRAGVPVLCIGNLVAGGGGKTPVALMTMELIRTSGIARNPCLLSRGYGAALGGPVAVAPTHTAHDVGDEPLLLARSAPTIIARDRAAGARMAVALGHDFIVMDDGMQNPSLHKDFSLLVVDGASGFGNEMLLPAGPLRTPVHRGMQQANAVLVIGPDSRNILRHTPQGTPVLRANLVPQRPENPAARYHAFCGIAHPDKFRASLNRAGLNITKFSDYPDHYPYSRKDIDALRAAAQSDDARLITTAKDAARLGHAADEISFDVLDVHIEMEPESVSTLRALLQTVTSP